LEAVSKIIEGYTDKIPEQLLRALESGNCVLLAGAGVSRRCLAKNRQPLPAWQDLLSLLISWAANNKLLPSITVQELEKLLQRNEHLLVAEELIDSIGANAVHDFLIEVFDPDGIIPSRLHELIVATPFRFIVTTNYDNLLERAFVNVQNRHVERVCIDELKRLKTKLKGSDIVLKLHGDLDRPESIILGQRQYQHLLQNKEYSTVLDQIFSENSILMIGYGLNDTDILLTLDRLARVSSSQPPHFLLCPEGDRTSIEKKRLAKDRNVHVIEYVDYLGYHNHIDTFLRDLNKALKNEGILERIRPSMRARVHIHYPENLTADGLFVWNFLFREGAITLSKEPQQDQLKDLGEKIAEGFEALDYLLFVVNANALNEGDFFSKVKDTLTLAPSKGVQIMFLVVGESERPTYLTKNVNLPVFYVDDGFSEKDLMLLRSYIKVV
jgi:SIR2-like domain